MTVLSDSDTIYHFCEGHDATQHAAFGEAAHVAITLRMHEESSYEGLDLVESEVRRRTFWLLFGGKFSGVRSPNATELAFIVMLSHLRVIAQRTSQCRYCLVARSLSEMRIPRVTSRGSSMTNSESSLTLMLREINVFADGSGGFGVSQHHA